MSNTYNALEIIKMAINMEKRGHEYYLDAANLVTNAKAKEMFLHLAGEEQKHLHIFTEYYNEVSKTPKLDDEYLFSETVSAYFKFLVDDAVFKNDDLGKTVNLISSKDILLEAINAEKNSILFYIELLHSKLNEESKESLALIIEEEKSHILELRELIKKL